MMPFAPSGEVAFQIGDEIAGREAEGVVGEALHAEGRGRGDQDGAALPNSQTLEFAHMRFVL